MKPALKNSEKSGLKEPILRIENVFLFINLFHLVVLPFIINMVYISGGILNLMKSILKMANLTIN